ncbi:hypothetical protein, partial [Rhodococcus sp. IEGM 1343]|uniref:hypothetical protein n=1 Tax=Rhodococcus sp. IEGM 1343 TaxID=3082224 RepID=UPI0029552819
MTLILAATVGHHVFHTSDRLITVPSRVKNRSQAWDIASNKTVIVVASDCWLVIGYTGLAYLDGIPTDLPRGFRTMEMTIFRPRSRPAGNCS